MIDDSLKQTSLKKSTMKDVSLPYLEKPWLNEFQNRATELDIYFIFRLILGRNPNREEWPGHSERKGELLFDILKQYVNSEEFKDRKLLASYLEPDYKKIKYDGFEIYASPSDIAVGKHVLSMTYELHVTYIFKAILEANMCVIDIGANIGYFSMLSSSLVGDNGVVLAVEPNPSNIKLIELSRRANKFNQVKLVQAAANTHEGIMALRCDYSNGECSSLPTDERDLFNCEIVSCVRLDKLIEKKVDLIKVDVEGGELKALQGCTKILDKYKPIVIFEFSPNRITDNKGNSGWKGLLDMFFERKYQLAVIKPKGNLWVCQNSNDAYNYFLESGVSHIDLIAFHGPLPANLTRKYM